MKAWKVRRIAGVRTFLLLLPAVLYTVGAVSLNVILNVMLSEPSLLWYGWALLLWISGILLYKGKWGGALPGLLPAVQLMYMGMQYTGQVINIEFPLGVGTAIYVAVCGVCVWRKGAVR